MSLDDCVIHLVSAAKGAESFYSLDNNEARSEDLAHARELDEKVMNSWNGHASLQVIDNSTNFHAKCDRVVQGVRTRLGLNATSVLTEPEGKTVIKHKFVVTGFDWDDLSNYPLGYRDFLVEHTFLSNPDTSNGLEIRIRR